jgi:hypothetical protein
MQPITFSPPALDALLTDHHVLANVDGSIATIRALGLEPRPAIIRQQCALQDIDPSQTEFLVALIGRRLSSLEEAL